jgi:hypothetical protein
MRFASWKPERGWRAFATELIVVILGVLIALGAEQAVSSLRRQDEVNSFRSAIEDELASNLAAFDFRLRQQPCVKSRIAELKAIRDQALDGVAAGVGGEIGRPSVASMRISVWNARDSEVMGAMPLDLRLAYSELYDELLINYEQITQEREAWRSLARFNGVPRLGQEDARTMSELVFRAETIDRVLGQNAPLIEEKAKQLGVRPSERMMRFLGTPDGGLCESLLH